MDQRQVDVAFANKYEDVQKYIYVVPSYTESQTIYTLHCYETSPLHWKEQTYTRTLIYKSHAYLRDPLERPSRLVRSPDDASIVSSRLVAACPPVCRLPRLSRRASVLTGVNDEERNLSASLATRPYLHTLVFPSGTRRIFSIRVSSLAGVSSPMPIYRGL